jgi:hypothetical protein
MHQLQIEISPTQPLWLEQRFIGLRRIFFPSGAQGWLLRGQTL